MYAEQQYSLSSQGFSRPRLVNSCDLGSGTNSVHLGVWPFMCYLHMLLVTWSLSHPPLEQVHAITLPSGAILLAFDDSERLRTPLALAMSRNGGETWYGILL